MGLSANGVLEAFRPHIYFGSDVEERVEIDEDTPLDFSEAPRPRRRKSRAA